MTAKVEQLQSEWRRLIALAQRGEEVLLTRQGQAVARLSGVPSANLAGDRRVWLKALAQLRETTATKKLKPTTDDILEDLRSERG
ncbi:MAG: hypothetical protein ACREIC_10695 [Limisphaerales bacterium]